MFVGPTFEFYIKFMLDLKNFALQLKWLFVYKKYQNTGYDLDMAY